MSATNQAEFSRTLADWSAKLKIGVGMLQRKIAFDIHKDITDFTPVDTGRARANWNVSIGGPSKDIALHEGLAKGAAIAPPEFPANLNIDGTTDVYIVNNVVYIQFLDEGSSQQAPMGMVRLAMQAQDARLAAATGENDWLAGQVGH